MENLNLTKAKGYENALKNAVPFPQHYYQQAGAAAAAPAPAQAPQSPDPKGNGNKYTMIVILGLLIVGSYLFYTYGIADDESERNKTSKNN